jgi:predicted nucleotidyltransferase
MNSRQHIITSRIKNIVRETDPNAVTILYGSRATGKAKKNSDWDILILLDKTSVSVKEEQLFRHNLYDLELETGESISTFVYAKNDWNTRLSNTPIYQAIKQQGIVL